MTTVGPSAAEARTTEPIEASRPSARAIALRTAFFVVMAVALYLFLPGLIALFGSADQLTRVGPQWFVLMVLFETASFALVSVLTKLLLPGASMFGITSAQLVGHVMSTIVPGGAATGGAVQFRMLTTAGAEPGSVGSAMTVQGVVLTSAVFTLPVFALPAIIFGAGAPPGLLNAALLGVAFFLLLVAVAALVLFHDPTLRLVAHLVDVGARVLHRPAGSIDDRSARLIGQRNAVRANLGRHWWQAVLVSVGKWLLEYFVLVAALAAVGAHPRPSLVLLAYTASAVLTMISITPGGLGFVEAGLAATLALAGVDPAAATLATLAYRLVTYWLPLPVGGVLYVLFRHRYRRSDPARAPSDSEPATARNR